MLTVYGTGRPSTDRIMKKFARLLKTRFEPIETFCKTSTLRGVTKEVMLMGVLRGTARVYKLCQITGVPLYYLDNPYFIQGSTKDYLRMSKNKFCCNTLEDYPDDRLKNFNVTIEDWSSNRGNSILVIPPTHAMCWFFDQYTWLDNTINEIKKYTDRPIIIRHKPFNPKIDFKTHQPIDESSDSNTTVPLSEDLKKAHCVVTFNSNSAIQALQTGIPVICNDNCPAYPLTNRFQDIENLTLHDNRQQLFNTLAYSQFSQSEIASGFAFQYV
jgi:hypothetical protein